MASTGSIGYGLKIGYSADNAAFTSVAQVADTDLNLDVDVVPITNNDSPGGRKEKIPGLVDPGQTHFLVIYQKTALTALQGLLRQIKYWRVTVQDNSTWVAQGFIKNLKQNRPVEDKETLDVTVEHTGQETWTAA